MRMTIPNVLGIEGLEAGHGELVVAQYIAQFSAWIKKTPTLVYPECRGVYDGARGCGRGQLKKVSSIHTRFPQFMSKQFDVLGMTFPTAP
jgi:hypothetical protein